MHSSSNKDFNKQPAKDKPLVLIVDNDHDNLLLVSCVVESMGINHVTTDDSEQCLDLVEELLPDVILLDIVMPKINGLELAGIIRQDQKNSHIPLLAVTGLTKTEDMDKLMAVGFNDYLTKPYLIEELESKLSSLLNYPSV